LNVSKHLSGGCQCGAVRFRVESGMLGSASICHCRMCQKAFGNWGAALVSVPLLAFKWTRGKPCEFRSSSIVARGFCEKCGTPLYMLEDGYDKIEMAIGAFDDPNCVDHLEKQFGVESRVKWFMTMHELPEQTTEDNRSPQDMAKLKSLQHPDHDTESWP
jgi:hypothetical protein